MRETERESGINSRFSGKNGARQWYRIHRVVEWPVRAIYFIIPPGIPRLLLSRAPLLPLRKKRLPGNRVRGILPIIGEEIPRVVNRRSEIRASRKSPLEGPRVKIRFSLRSSNSREKRRARIEKRERTSLLRNEDKASSGGRKSRCIPERCNGPLIRSKPRGGIVSGVFPSRGGGGGGGGTVRASYITNRVTFVLRERPPP